MRINPAQLLLRVTAGLTLVAFTCGFQYAYITNPANGLPYKWRSATIPMQVMVDNTTVLSDGTTRATCIVAAMQDSLRGWNPYLGAVQFVPQIVPVGTGVNGDGINQIFFSSTPYNQSWEANTLAVTTSWYNGNQRIEADVIFNSAYTWDSYRGTEKTGTVDLQRVALHELGHVLGLDHPDTAGQTVPSVMNSSAVSTDSLQVYDVLAAQFLYGAPGVPHNDNFASATVIKLVTNSTTVYGYNTNATLESGEPNHANNAGGRSVWWSWTATSSGSTTVTTAGSVFNTTLAVYTGSSVSALTQIAANDDVQAGVTSTSSVTFNAVAGTTYYIAVDGFNNSDGLGADLGGIALNLTFTAINGLQSQTVVTGHTVTLSVSGPGDSYQWQYSSNNGATWSDLAADTYYSGVTTANLTITNASLAMSGLRFRVMVTSGGVSSPSDVALLTVSQALFTFPASIAIDGVGNLYVGDTSLDTVQIITSTTSVGALAGSTSTAGSADGIGTAARFNQPSGLSATAGGVVDVSDTANATIRVIQPDGTVTTLAGSASVHGNTDATGSAASFSSPIGIARDYSGNLYIADAMNHTIRMVTPGGVVTTFAGSAGAAGSTDGTGNLARFNYPTGIAVDSSGNAYVADTTNNLLRKITPAGAVTTIAGVAGVAGSSDGTGANALFNAPGGLALDASGNVYLADTGNSTIRKITPAGVVSTFAGLPGIAGLRDGSGSTAWFNQPKSLVLDSSGNVYVADTGNAAIRKITPAGVVTTLSLVPATTTSSSTSTSSSTISPTGTGSSSSSSGGGGGGAPSGWFLGALGLLAGLRWIFPRRIRA